MLIQQTIVVDPAITGLVSVDTFTGYYTNTLFTTGNIELVLGVISAEIESYCNRAFNINSYIDWNYIPYPQNAFTLSQYPIVSISSIESSSTTDGDLSTIVDDYYSVDVANGLVRLGSYTANWIKTAYIAGYSTIPADLQMIVMEMTFSRLSSARLDRTYTSESVGDYSYTRGSVKDSQLLDNYTKVLAQYKRVVI